MSTSALSGAGDDEAVGARGSASAVSACGEGLLEAVRVYASQVLRNAIEDLEWEDYPDIGEHDWQRVVECCYRLVPAVGDQDWNGAVALLESRAEDTA